MLTPGNEASRVPNHIHLQRKNEGTKKEKGITANLTSTFTYLVNPSLQFIGVASPVNV